MGTPQFACPTLEKLINDSNFEIVAVYSREPQIAGRGQKLQNSPIHNLAIKHNLKVITPKTLRDDDVQQQFIAFNADVAVVVAYGLILPTKILNGTKYGCFNIHPSLLPRWRGAAPIQRTIMNGDNETAVCVIKMNEGLDSGNIVEQRNYKLLGNETYADLEKKFAESGAEILIESLKKLQNNQLQEVVQDHSLATYAKKIDKTECQINWQETAVTIERQIRGLSGSLGAFFMLNGEKIKIFAAEILDQHSTKKSPGEIWAKDFSIQCAQGIIRPLILQRQGRVAMSIDEFLLGFNKNA